jgi:nudix-type nucleoside diphosphatase (YffH/AdpP family)
MSEDNSRQPRKIERISQRRLLNDFFKIDEHVVRHEKFGGAMSGEHRVLVFERGDAAAALLYDPGERKVILINQFRLPTVGKAGSEGWLTETAAGMVSAGETPEQCIVREIAEETGYLVTQLHPVAEFFSSPGGTSELIHLFYAEVRAGDRHSAGGGVAADGEDIRLDEYPLATFLDKLANRAFKDPKIIIAGQWLKARLG